MYDAAIYGSKAINLNLLLSVCKQALGYNPAANADASGRRLGPAEQYISILAAAQDRNATPELYQHLLNFWTTDVVIGADERDLPEIQNFLTGMMSLILPTKARGTILILVTGTLNQWRTAIISGTNSPTDIQGLFCKLVGMFESEGLKLWTDQVRRPDGRQFYLEHQ